ncbi:MAG: TIM-barrel domain-containing protein [Myxococcota bacterium]
MHKKSFLVLTSRRSLARVFVLLSALPLVLFVACSSDDDDTPPGSNLPAMWSLSADGIQVEVQREPYGYVVRNTSGDAVLQTLGADGARRADDDGYAPVSYTTGEVSWLEGALTKGHYTFIDNFDPWREDWVVVNATEEATALTLELRRGGEGEDVVRIRHALRSSDVGSALRVEVETEGTVPRAVAAAFATDPSEGFLGLGERFTRTNHRGTSVFSWSEEGGIGDGEGSIPGPTNPAPNGEAMTYYPVPFFISTNGYGFWLDTTWRNTFDFSTDHEDAWRAWEIGPSTTYEVYLPSDTDTRLWPYQLIDQFTATTGRPMVPPEWTYGPRRRVGRNSVVGGASEIETMRTEDLAITAVDDAVHFLPEGSHVGVEDALRAWVADGHRLGYRVNCYYNSLYAANEDNPLRAEVVRGVDNDHFLLDQNGGVSAVELISGTFLTVYQVDFTSPEATTFFQSSLDWAIDLDYDGFMYDFGEYVQPRAVAQNGMTGEELHNLYPVLYDKAVFDHMEASTKAGEWLAFARSGYTGSSQYIPMVWAGDPAASFEEPDGLPSMIPAGVNLSMSGAPNWGGDIGGFHCAADGASLADGELLARWIQQGALTPNMQDQSACSLSLDGGTKATIWTAAEAFESWRVYARLHTRLFPYLWAMAQRAHATGEPMMRQLFLEHPDQPALADDKTSYYFGPGLFVAPILERGARSRRVAFPPGRFLDWRDFAVYEGGTEATIDAPLTELPLFLRDGHLIPLLDPTIDTLAEETNADVIGRADVADVYDVVGFVSTATGEASFTLAGGEVLQARWTGGFQAPTGTETADEAELSTCTELCFLVEDLASGVRRVRISSPSGAATAGGLALESAAGRRIRWDLFLHE